VKGSEISETLKSPIYKTLVRKCEKNFEIAIILLDLQKCDAKMRDNSSRTFNFLIKRYLETYFKEHSRYNAFNTLNFIIDERNVSTGAKYLLEEYLNIELNLASSFSKEDLKVEYKDSKNYLNLQLIDFISNSYYRYYQKNNAQSKENIELLKNSLCKLREYKFPL
jgi:hypothetical protein